MRKNYFFVILLLVLISTQSSCKEHSTKNEKNNRPVLQHEEERNNNPDKHAIWTPEQAANHQQVLLKLVETSKTFNTKNRNRQTNIYANGALGGTWINRGPKNMPGAFKFAEMLDGTDIIYGVTLNHYAGEYNSKSYIYKGTVYNKTTGVGGDDFELLTANWPNRYQNLFAFEVNGGVRLVAHIENGPLYFSDDDGVTWTQSQGLPNTNTSSVINRQNNHIIYVTNNTSVYVSTDKGVSFSLLQNFGSSRSSFLYTPRYSVQDNADEVYLTRSGSFYKLNNTQTGFSQRGSYVNNHGSVELSIGGDKRMLYATENKNYWVSTDEGVSWTQKFPKGNWYGDRTGKMSPGMFYAAHPENPMTSIAGYAHPIISNNGLSSTLSDEAGWGRYQNGNNLSPQQYYNRIRFNYHPDFQASHFFYNSSGDLFSARCSDGGIFISYKEWSEFPSPGAGYNNSGYQNAHFINLNVLNTITPLVYRKNAFTGINNTNHINYATQDQGSQSIIPNTSGNVLDFYQSIGGDGPPIDSYDGINAWKWNRQGEKVWSPVKVYSNSGAFQSIGTINSRFNSSQTVNFSSDSEMGWAQTYIDNDRPDENIWMLTKKLHRAKWNGSSLQGLTIDKGDNQVAALTQGIANPNKLYMLQDSKVFISNNRGDSFGTGINTPFSKTPGGWTKGDIGSGIVLPGNDNWVLFSGPSNNNVGSILSKDGGNTWVNVTGDFPAGNDAQTGGMVATPDGKFIFAGTDIGPYVFDVSQEKWFSIAEGIGFFNTMDIEYIEATNTIRFASWGSGILDFNIEDILSTDENKITDKLNIYPNPANDYVMIKLGTTLESEIQIDIYNLKGQRIYSTKHAFYNDSTLKLDTSSISAGMYIIKLKNNKQYAIAQRLIIN